LIIPQISFGQITFFKTYGDTTESHYDQGYAVLQTEDGGYIVAGETGFYWTSTPYHGYGDVYLIRTDAFGDTLWTKTYGDVNAREVAYSMDKTADGGYTVCAYSEAHWGLWLIKIDSKGDSLWTKKFDLGKGNHIITTSDGGFVITGHEGYHLPDNNADVYLLKLDSNGNTQWQKKYDKNLIEEGTYVQQTSDGGYIVAGITSGRSLDIWLIKTDSKGDTLWTKTYDGDYIDEPHSILETKDGGYFIAGEYTEEGELGLELHIWLLKTNAQGDTLWTRKINNGSWGDYAYAMKKTSDGGYIITGETTYDNFDSDIYLIKLDEEENYKWFSTIGRNLGENGDEKNYRGNDIAETADGGYIITGFKWIWFGWDEYQDLCLLKVDYEGQLSSVDEEKEKIPSNFTLSQNYPNTFNPRTTIAFDLPEESHVTLTIYDVMGREIVRLLNENQPAGFRHVVWDGKDKSGQTVSSGIYLYTLKTSTGFSETKKMALMR